MPGKRIKICSRNENAQIYYGKIEFKATKITLIDMAIHFNKVLAGIIL